MSEKEEGKEKIDKNVKKSNTEPKPESRSKVKAKPKTKDKKSEKPNQHKIILDPEFETRLREIDVKNVFKLNSNTKDEKILNGLIYLHKVIEYKCANDKCGIQGEWLGNPLELLLVHKNNKENDNRIKNLRELSHKQNMKNQSLYRNNTSGHAGVHWIRRDKRWLAQIQVNGKKINLGYFKEKEDAIKARKEAEAKYKFHKNHGR